MASISTRGVELLAGWLNFAAGFNACKSASANPGRRLLTWRAISASEASNFDAVALSRCWALRLPATCSEEVPATLGCRCMGCGGLTADTAETPASALKVTIAKIREDIRGLPGLPRL